jgi:hypothetical protein
MNAKSSLRIKFEGQTHQIDANTLINTLVHYQTVIAEANKELTGGAKTIELKVNAIEKGSFVIDVSIIEGTVKQIFSSDRMELLANLTTILGGLYSAYKLLHGKPAKTKAEKQSIEVNETIIHGNVSINKTIVNQTIINVYNQPVVREAISKTIETSDADVSVEGLSIDTGIGSPVTFSREEFKDYIYDDFDHEVEDIPDEKIEDVEATLTIIGLNFEPGSKWQFMYNGFKINMIVKDDALMQAIDEGERFGKGDAIHVRMRILKRYNQAYKAYENKSYKIIEYYKHINHIKPTQGNLEFES